MKRGSVEVPVGHRRGGAVAALAVGVLGALGGCEIAAQPPTTPAALARSGPVARERWGREKIALYNLRRVQDERLDAAARIASLAVVLDEVGPDPWVLRELATVLAAGRAPAPVRRAVLAVLISQDDPRAEPYVQEALRAAEGGLFQQALLDWLTRHPHRPWLADVVCLWARADGSEEATETRFRRTVETLSARPWSDALLAGLNDPDFTARRSALAVLAARLDHDVLARRIAALPSQTVAVEAMQYTLGRIDYLPAADELLAVVEAYVARRDRLDAALAVAEAWTAAGEYTFTIRDMHLLAGLTDETLRRGRREPLLSRLDAQLRVQTRRAAAPIGDAVAATPLSALSTAALVRLHLLSGMLERGDLAAALARRCRRQGASWGGLVFLDDGAATTHLYAPASPADGPWQPSGRMLQDARFAVACIHGRPADTAPPSVIPDAVRHSLDRLGTPAVAVWLAAPGQLAAVYYDRDGTWVPLGAFGVEGR